MRRDKGWWRTVNWSNSFVSAVSQDMESGAALTLAWVNRDALVRTITLGCTWFYSRSRQSIWAKGKQSGNNQFLLEARIDCDADAVLMLVGSWTWSCHAGRLSCFNGAIGCCFGAIVGRVVKLTKPKNSNTRSYTRNQLCFGPEKLLKKITEEAAELAMAQTKGERILVVKEAGDLYYHLLLALVTFGVQPVAVASELKGRTKLSGLQEKLGRIT